MEHAHPGQLIQRRFMNVLGINMADLAKALDVSHSTISRIISGKSEISADMALRLSHVLGMEAKTWMAIQAAHSLNAAQTSFSADGLKKLWEASHEPAE